MPRTNDVNSDPTFLVTRLEGANGFFFGVASSVEFLVRSREMTKWDIAVAVHCEIVKRFLR